MSFKWDPATSAQQAAIDCEAQLLLFGGSAGSLKSETLCVDAIQERDNPNLRAIMFRQSFPQLSEIVEKTHRLYKPLDAEYNKQEKTWTFPSGAKVILGYLETDTDVFEYWGKEVSWIGFDESTMHSEKQIRTIISRLRSTDDRLRQRVRLATNPGGQGASFHQEIFLHGACPVHEPDKCVIPGKLYHDRYWPSDKKPIPMSVAFIPGKLSDHNLLGADYIQKLRMQEGSLADQLEQGCWCKLEGAYFAKIWNKTRMVAPYGSVDERYWYQFWIALDYGFGKSRAAAGLYVKTPPVKGFPDGRIFKLAELCVPHTPAYEFAAAVVDRFIKPELQEHRRNISVIYLDPANFKDIGDGHTIADQLNEVFGQYELACTPASNDRIGGWQLAYRMLDSGEFAFTDTCPMSAEAIRTRVHDEKKPGDVLKVSGDPLDDVADETRYALYSFINQTEKPREIKLAEAMKPHLDRGDLTNANLAAQRFRRQEEEEEYGTYAGAGVRQRMAMMSRRRAF